MLPSSPGIAGYAAVVGKKEGQGPLGKKFDYIYEDAMAGEKSWEKAESAMQKKALAIALVCNSTSALCRDCGESALADKAELAGKVAILSLCIPLLVQLLDLF